MDYGGVRQYRAYRGSRAGGYTHYIDFLASRHWAPSDATGVISPGNSLNMLFAIGPLE